VRIGCTASLSGKGYSTRQVRWATTGAQPNQRIWLRFVRGRPVSDMTTQFPEWSCHKLQAMDKRGLVLVWDNASWHDIHYRAPRQANYRQIALSNCVGKRELGRSDVEMYTTWSEILPILEKEMGSGTRVCVYPYQGNVWQKIEPRAAGASGGPRQGGGGD